jgi:hypothetical protein
MPVLGVLTCEILELEFAHLLEADPGVRAVTVLEDDLSQQFVSALERSGSCEPKRISNLTQFTGTHSGQLEVLVRVLELGLHNRKRSLQEGLVQAAKEMGPCVDAILLGYGLCGNALENPQVLLADAGVPIFIPWDQDHPVDDCVGLIIGGRDIYYAEQCRVAGTFFMIPGWTRHWRRIFKKENGGWDVEFAKRLFKMSDYQRSLLIPNGVLSDEEMRRSVEEFNHLFGLRTEVRQGTMDLLRCAWEAAKGSLTAVRMAEAL